MSALAMYKPFPVTFSHGEGIYLWDTEGKQYLDGLTGIAVCGLGHAHPAVTKTIQEQAAKLLHTSNLYHIEAQEKLADYLTQLTGMDQAFFCNSGAEANEAAIKLARLYGHQQNIEQPTIVVMNGAFHGRTMATLTASGSRKVQAGFEPLVPGFVRCPYNDLQALTTIAENANNIVAVLVEPVQGEGGINIPDENYLDGLRTICDQNNWLLMLDEVQTGNGRTGEWFAFQHTNHAQPDVLITAKGLGNGVPIGACLMRAKAKDIFQPGQHGSTFGGNPLATRTAMTVLETLAEKKYVQNAKNVGQYLLDKLELEFANYEAVCAIRGKGLMIGLELDRPCRELINFGLTHGLLFNVTHDKVVRLLPPLIINEHDADEIVSRLKASMDAFLNS